MSKFEGLENDITYLRYNNLKQSIKDSLDNDEVNFVYIKGLVGALELTKKELDFVKEYRNGKDRNINTEVRESN